MTVGCLTRIGDLERWRSKTNLRQEKDLANQLPKNKSVFRSHKKTAIALFNVYSTTCTVLLAY